MLDTRPCGGVVSKWFTGPRYRELRKRARSLPDDTLRLSHGYDRRGSRRSGSAGRFRAVLARAAAAVPRTGRRGLRGIGFRVGAERDSGVDSRWRAMASGQRAGRGCGHGGIFVYLVPARAAHLKARTSSRDRPDDEEGKLAGTKTGVQDPLGPARRAALQPGDPASGTGRAASRLSRRISLYPRDLSDDVPQPVVDHAAVRRIRHGGGVQQALPLSPRQGTDGLVGG